MKFDPAAMRALLALDDAHLWQKICGIAAASGVALSDSVPPQGEMEKLRRLLGSCGQGDVASALQALAAYRRAR